MLKDAASADTNPVVIHADGLWFFLPLFLLLAFLQLVRYRCRKCRQVLATGRNVIPPEAAAGSKHFGRKWTKPQAPPDTGSSSTSTETAAVLPAAHAAAAGANGSHCGATLNEKVQPSGLASADGTGVAAGGDGPVIVAAAGGSGGGGAAAVVPASTADGGECDGTRSSTNNQNPGDSKASKQPQQQTMSAGTTPRSAAAAAAAAAAANTSGDSSLFLEPMIWMQEAIVGAVQGKLYCPNCQARLGSFNWSGEGHVGSSDMGFWLHD